MNISAWRRRATTGLTCVALAALLPACDDGSSFGPDVPDGAEVGVVLNSIDRTLTVFEVERPDNMFTVGLGPDGSPATLALRGSTAVVPMGSVPAVVVVDLEEQQVDRVIELPAGSGATGVAFLDDDIIIVGNSNLDSVSPVNIRTGVVLPEILVGLFPESIISDGQRVFVVNAELDDNFQPARTGTISVIDNSLQVIATIEMSGENPGFPAIDAQGRMFVPHRGRFMQQEGSLSVVSTGTFEEIAFDRGFDDFPTRAAIDESGNVFISSTEFGIVIWDPEAREFIRDPFNPVAPGGNRSAAGLAFGPDGRLYALQLECTRAADVFRLSMELNLERTIRVGTCPFDIAFTTLES